MACRIIDYRNCRFQGLTENIQPHGEGILLDDTLRLTVGTWINNQLNGNVVVFDTYEKYIYGVWENGLPQGLNVYREGETILVANYEKGSVVGKFLVIFETQGLALILQMEKEEAVILKKTEISNQAEVEKIGRQIIPNQKISEILSLLNFVSKSYSSSPRPSGIALSEQNSLYWLGIQNGLGILFGQNDFIHRVGHLSKERQVVQIGGSYTSNESKQGDFQSGQITIYKDERPVHQVKRITHQFFLRSVNFRNQYFLTKIPQVLSSISNFVKKNVISQIAQNTLHDSKRYIQDFNDSLQYRPKDKSENERLKKVRAQLYLSIGRPGSQVKPISPLIIDQFIATEEKQKQVNSKYSISNKYSNISSKWNHENQDSRQLTARFEAIDYRKHSSPLPYQNTSTRVPNKPAKLLYSDAPGWMEESKRVMEIRRSKSPIHPSLITSSNINRSNSIRTFNPVKHQELRTKVLNEYKNVSIKQSQSIKLSPHKADNILSSESNINKHSRHESTDIKTISRRLDKTEPPTRSPQKYSYLNSIV